MQDNAVPTALYKIIKGSDRTEPPTAIRCKLPSAESQERLTSPFRATGKTKVVYKYGAKEGEGPVTATIVPAEPEKPGTPSPSRLKISKPLILKKKTTKVAAPPIPPACPPLPRFPAPSHSAARFAAPRPAVPPTTSAPRAGPMLFAKVPGSMNTASSTWLIVPDSEPAAKKIRLTEVSKAPVGTVLNLVNSAVAPGTRCLLVPSSQPIKKTTQSAEMPAAASSNPQRESDLGANGAGALPLLDSIKIERDSDEETISATSPDPGVVPAPEADSPNTTRPSPSSLALPAVSVEKQKQSRKVNPLLLQNTNRPHVPADQTMYSIINKDAANVSQGRLLCPEPASLQKKSATVGEETPQEPEDAQDSGEGVDEVTDVPASEEAPGPSRVKLPPLEPTNTRKRTREMAQQDPGVLTRPPEVRYQVRKSVIWMPAEKEFVLKYVQQHNNYDDVKWGDVALKLNKSFNTKRTAKACQNMYVRFGIEQLSGKSFNIRKYLTVPKSQNVSDASVQTDISIGPWDYFAFARIKQTGPRKRRIEMKGQPEPSAEDSPRPTLQSLLRGDPAPSPKASLQAMERDTDDAPSTSSREELSTKMYFDSFSSEPTDSSCIKSSAKPTTGGADTVDQSASKETPESSLGQQCSQDSIDASIDPSDLPPIVDHSEQVDQPGLSEPPSLEDFLSPNTPSNPTYHLDSGSLVELLCPPVPSEPPEAPDTAKPSGSGNQENIAGDDHMYSKAKTNKEQEAQGATPQPNTKRKASHPEVLAAVKRLSQKPMDGELSLMNLLKIKVMLETRSLSGIAKAILSVPQLTEAVVSSIINTEMYKIGTFASKKHGFVSQLAHNKYEDLMSLSMGKIAAEMITKFPHTSRMIMSFMLPHTKRFDPEAQEALTPRLGMIYSIMMQSRFSDLSRVQRFLTMTLVDQVCDKKIYRKLQSLGITLSYTSSLTLAKAMGKQIDVDNID